MITQVCIYFWYRPGRNMLSLYGSQGNPVNLVQKPMAGMVMFKISSTLSLFRNGGDLRFDWPGGWDFILDSHVIPWGRADLTIMSR
jgi:hypothetical protein